MKKVLIIGAAAASAFAANAALLSVDFLGGSGGPANEVPAVTAPGANITKGGGFMYVDDVGGGLSIQSVQFNNLTAPASSAWLGNGTVTQTGVPFGSPITINTLNPLSTSGTLTSVQNIGSLGVAQLKAGNVFINVATPTNPGGEVRGQLFATGGQVPEPAETAAVVGLGLAGFALWRRRQAK